MNETWKKVMDLKKKETRTKGIANTLTNDEIETIIATMEFMGASDNFLHQSMYDLRYPRYRLFDWIAMCIAGRRNCGDGNNDLPVQVITYSFLKSEGDVDKFIEDLRVTDYDIDKSYEAIIL